MNVRGLSIWGNSRLRRGVTVLPAVVIYLAVSACGTADGRQREDPPAIGSSDNAPTAVVMGPEDGDHLWLFADNEDKLGEFQIFVDPETFPKARGSFAKFALEVGGSLPVHRHDKTEEIGYFLSGEGIVTVYDNGTPRDIPVREGCVVYVPPGSWHTIKNTGDEPFGLVFATVPNEKKGLLSFFRRIGVKPGEVAAPVSPEEFARLAAEHDLILRPPEQGN